MNILINWVQYYGLKPNISFPFQVVKNLSAHSTYLRFWAVWNLGINSFSQRISKIDGNRKLGRFDVVLKLEFELANG